MIIFATQPGHADRKFARDAWLRALQKTAGIAERAITLPQLIARLGVEFAARPALSSPEASFTYAQLSARCHQYARWGISAGLVNGDVVALMMQNCAEYVAVWLGLSRIGVTVALINSQLAGDILAHSVNIAGPKYLISGADLAPRIDAIRQLLPAQLEYRVHGASRADLVPLDAELAAFTGELLPASERLGPSLDSTALYMYTSGTTGLPKAAKVSHYRLMQWSHWFAGMMDTQPSDRMFNCLPLYHSVGGVVANFATLVSGGTVVLRPRFSASDFWRDVRDERCTLFQYIGELCRYLVNTPNQPIETEHVLRVACGNGLRPEVWDRFKERFRIPRILEYYASTEGNFSLYNCEQQPGAIGRIPAFLSDRLPVALLRFDAERSEPWRNAEGLCERCAANEVGEAVGLIPPDNRRAGRFEGYADEGDSTRKVLRNVFDPGDAWYRSGDLMRRDEQGFYYFVDRAGDTYRWKGENVSTAEVLSALTACRGVIDGVVYGVEVPGSDGRAGTAALVVEDKAFDLAAFREEAASRLPPYARPVFLRILSSLETTGTFKPRKQDYIRQGFNPERSSDVMYFDDARVQRYVPLDSALFEAISNGALRI